MSTPNTNPLTYNNYIAQVAAMAVYQTQSVAGITSFLDAPPTLITPMMLNYAEIRIQRDLDLLASQTTNTYTTTAGNPILSLPVDDFFTVQTMSVDAGGETPLLPVSKEFIQNCFSGQQNAGKPRYFAMVGDNWGNGGDINNNVLLGPPPNYTYTIRVTGTIRTPSLYKYASAGAADTNYTWISSYVPDMLLMASMIYISAFQRNFGDTADDSPMAMSYEKQYQALRLGGVPEENRRKFQGSGWSSYSTPTSATPTR